ncbi:MAG: hypothetical protein ACXVA3_07840 [Vulcanimicrobiaceae bacterium]
MGRFVRRRAEVTFDLALAHFDLAPFNARLLLLTFLRNFAIPERARTFNHERILPT